MLLVDRHGDRQRESQLPTTGRADRDVLRTTAPRSAAGRLPEAARQPCREPGQAPGRLRQPHHRRGGLRYSPGKDARESIDWVRALRAQQDSGRKGSRARAQRLAHERKSTTLVGWRIQVGQPTSRTADNDHGLPVTKHDCLADRDPLTRESNDRKAVQSKENPDGLQLLPDIPPSIKERAT